MEKIVLLHVEDDAQYLERLIDYVRPEKFNILKADTFEDAREIIENSVRIDCAVVDMMLPRDQNSRSGRESDVHDYGAQLIRLLRRRFDRAFVIGTSKRDELSRAEHSFINHFIVKRDDSRYLRSISHLIRVHYGLDGAFPMNCFIVHGHNSKAVNDLKTWLSVNTIFDDTVVLADQPSSSLSIIEKFEVFAAESDAVFVLLTRDDRAISEAELAAQESARMENGSLPADLARLRYRARQNVIFEAGYFLGRFGRQQGRVFLLFQGNLELPSDLAGMVYIDISNGIGSAHDDLRRELQDFAC